MATKRTQKPPPVPEDEGPPEVEGVAFLTPQQARARFDQEAHRVLGIPGAEFVRRWEGGEYARPRPVRGRGSLSPPAGSASIRSAFPNASLASQRA